MVTLALYKRRRWHDLGGALIRWWTNSPYSHCEIVSDGKWYSSSIRDGGVREKVIDDNPDYWDFVPVPWVKDSQVFLYYVRTCREEYGWKDLILRQFFNKRGNSRGAFCSEWCAAALGLSSAETYSPHILWEYCKVRQNDTER